MSTRVYVPTSAALLRQVVTSDGVGPAPFVAHAVTDRLRTAWADASDEEWEYAASATGAQASLGLLTEADAPRRLVLALDVATVTPVDGDDPTMVEVAQAVPFRRIAAVLADDADAEDAVAAARDAFLAAEQGDDAAERVVERCLDHELGWWATQEIGHLLEVL